MAASIFLNSPGLLGQMVQHSQDGRWDLWVLISFGCEAILISDVIHAVDNAVLASILIESLCTKGFLIQTDFYKTSRLLSYDSRAGFKSGSINKITQWVYMLHEHQYMKTLTCNDIHPDQLFSCCGMCPIEWRQKQFLHQMGDTD